MTHRCWCIIAYICTKCTYVLAGRYASGKRTTCFFLNDERQSLYFPSHLRRRMVFRAQLSKPLPLYILEGKKIRVDLTGHAQAEEISSVWLWVPANWLDQATLRIRSKRLVPTKYSGIDKHFFFALEYRIAVLVAK